MSYLKSIMLTLLVLIGITVSYSYVKFDSKYALKKALSAYKKKDYTTANYYLSALNNKKNPRYSFYQGYIERAKGHLDTSSNLFDKAKNISRDKIYPEEVDFNLYLNAYLKNDSELLDKKLKEASTKNNAYHLFKGLSAYNKKDYASAKNNFAKIRPGLTKSNWMELDWNNYFDESKMVYCKAHSEIESGSPFKARQEIENFLSKSENKDPKYCYLIGLSYFKEAEQKNLELSIPYYQIAFTHFKRVPFLEPEFKVLKENVRTNYEKLLTSLLENSMYEELGCFLEAISYLDGSVEKIASVFLDHIRKEASFENKTKLTTLTTQTLAFCNHSEFKKKVRESLYFYLQNLIENNKTECIKHIWPIYNQISLSPEEDREAFTKLMIEKLNSLIDRDDNTLSKSKASLQLLLSIDSQEKKIFEVTSKIKEIWKSDAEKAWLLTKHLDHLILDSQKESFHKKIVEILDDLQEDLKLEEKPSKEIYKKANLYFKTPTSD